MTGGAEVDPPGRWRALALLATAMVLAMTTWFSATAVVPQLTGRWGLDATAASLLTIAVQLGFVTGALGSALLAVADVVPPRRVMLAGAVGASLANAGLLLADGAATAIALRFLTGVFLAGVYPPGLKAMATWFRRQRGTALGIMVGALTLGSAAPHLVNALGGLDWRLVVALTSVMTAVGGVLVVTGVGDGPFAFPRAPFELRAGLAVLRDRRVRLAYVGYFGHMWELYAMWAWTVVFLATSFEARGIAGAGRWAAYGAFAAIGIGALGCVAGGILADRHGRPFATSLALISSGTAAAIVGSTWGGPPALVLAVVLFWGFWVVADSAQFSAIVTEVADQRYVGTAVTLQLALGFVLTVVTIWLVPVLVEAVGWRWAFLALVPGPVAGTIAMRRLAGAAPTRGRTAGPPGAVV